MGVDIGDTQRVIHLGCSKSILSYWQEVAKVCMRRPACASIVYSLPISLGDQRRTDEDMQEWGRAVSKNTMCMRSSILRYFLFQNTEQPIQEDCRCKFIAFTVHDITTTLMDEQCTEWPIDNNLIKSHFHLEDSNLDSQLQAEMPLDISFAFIFYIISDCDCH